ncbi:GNAT family N-acetyltransferase [Pseudalkalibacillus caeni]|uniref:GNAT family N-acetyltransferase n=2 Tax=Exobacillus caeni TaxID=2574798 RepID=A0A5R9F6L0_9BACL|nr:GNAT family N-acetyltransferase [Pseudalkalibacillus caeni]
MKQMTRPNNEETYNLILNGINLALEESSPSKIVVAESKENEIIGVAFFNIGISLTNGGPYIWLNELYVDPDYRNRGVGRKLLLHVIYWAEHEGIKTIELETGINNEVTKHMYNSLGFYDIVSKRYGFSF